MPQEKVEVNEQDIEKTAEQMDDIEVAEEAARLLREKDAENAKLKKELARSKLYRTVDTEEEKVPTREDYLKVLSDSRTTNYDYAEAVVGLRKLELAEGNPDPLGEDGADVSAFFESVLKECKGDKTAFPALYSARLGKDLPEDAAAYKKALQKH